MSGDGLDERCSNLSPEEIEVALVLCIVIRIVMISLAIQLHSILLEFVQLSP